MKENVQGNQGSVQRELHKIVLDYLEQELEEQFFTPSYMLSNRLQWCNLFIK